MAYYERNLPHWQPDGSALFMTWRLHGSLPSPNWVRNEVEFNRIILYIERNPVSTGLVERVEDYPWSSARSR